MSVVLTPPLDWGLMTVLVLVAFPDPHSELHVLHELHEDTWQSITGGEKILFSANSNFNPVANYM